MHIKCYNQILVGAAILSTLIFLPSLNATFDCKETSECPVEKSCVLVNCTSAVDFGSGWAVGWKKGVEDIGKCFVGPLKSIQCYPYELHGERYFFGVCGPFCFSMGIEQSMSPDYIGEYYITNGSTSTLALNLSSINLGMESAFTSTIQETTNSFSSVGTPLIFENTSDTNNSKTPMIFENTSATTNPKTVKEDLSSDLSFTSTKSSRDEGKHLVTSNVLLIIASTGACIFGVLLSFFWYKIYKHWKIMHRLNVVGADSRRSHSYHGIGSTVFSKSMCAFHLEANISIPNEADQPTSDSFQAPHQGPKVAHSTCHQIKRKQQGGYSGMKPIKDGSEAPMGTDAERSKDFVNDMNDKDSFLRARHASVTTFLDDDVVYEEVSEYNGLGNEDLCNMPPCLSQAIGQRAGISVLRNAEEGGAGGVPYDVRLFHGDAEEGRAGGVPYKVRMLHGDAEEFRAGGLPYGVRLFHDDDDSKTFQTCQESVPLKGMRENNTMEQESFAIIIPQ